MYKQCLTNTHTHTHTHTRAKKHFIFLQSDDSDDHDVEDADDVDDVRIGVRNDVEDDDDDDDDEEGFTRLNQRYDDKSDFLSPRLMVEPPA